MRRLRGYAHCGASKAASRNLRQGRFRVVMNGYEARSRTAPQRAICTFTGIPCLPDSFLSILAVKFASTASGSRCALFRHSVRLADIQPPIAAASKPAGVGPASSELVSISRRPARLDARRWLAR